MFWARVEKEKCVINEIKTAAQTADKRRPTLAKIFSRELVRELRALFFRISSLNRLPVAAPSAADELFAAFCKTTRDFYYFFLFKKGQKKDATIINTLQYYGDIYQKTPD